MKCPYCGHNEDRVLDTREQREGESIRRRRECLKCKSRFSTTETLSVCYPFVIKKDGRREPYSKEKLLKGLQAACQKRPIALSQIENMVDRVSNWLIQRGDKEVPSHLLGKKLMNELRTLDNVAYIRFASVYRTFHDLQEFVETLEGSADFVESSGHPIQLQLAPEQLNIVESTAYEKTSQRTRIANPFSN